MQPVSNWEKLMLLIWKNWLLQWSRKIQLILVLILPIFFVLLLVLLRSMVKPQPMPQVKYKPISINHLNRYKMNVLSGNRILHDNGTLNIPKFMLAYSPMNDIYDKIMFTTVLKLDMFGFRGFSNSSELEDELLAHNYLAGVEFDDKTATITDYPRNFSFSLRFPSELRTSKGLVVNTWLTTRLFLPYDETGPRNHNESDGGIPVGYIAEGFLPIQHALATSYIQLAGSRGKIPNVKLQRYPYPKYRYDPLLMGLLNVLPLILLLSFTYPCVYIAKFVTHEKEKQLKEIMKIMGLHNWMHWTAWFIKSFILLLVVACVVTFLLKFRFKDDTAIFTSSNWMVILIFLVIYAIASICFCFMISVFCSKASTASAVTGMLWFLTYVPYSFAYYYYDRLSLTAKLFASLLSNTALGFGFRVMMAFEGSGEGIQWNNVATPVSSDDTLSLLYIILMLLLVAFIYMLICLYVEQIYPGKYGMPRKWYFPVQKEFWSKVIVPSRSDENYLTTKKVQFRNDTLQDAEVGISVIKLEKKFSKRTAVDKLTLDIYLNEITVLLGHNGAGKTTTILMLTGVLPPTSGTAIVNGFDICKNIDGARQSLGICPQHNVLFDDISVRNHIIFFSYLKGVRGQSALNSEVEKYTRIMELEDRAHVDASKLSGGMKRKLSLCCALCGDTKTVLCDEPSSGVDPAARRRLWDLLQAEKLGRTILLTTHHMDEADVLGDRVAIMCNGRLQCYDTPFMLKKYYANGYRLICVKLEDCVVNDVTKLLRKYIPNIEPESNIGTELIYRLPAEYTDRYAYVLRALETESSTLKLSGYGVGVASMEEVFMRVNADSLRQTGGKSSSTRETPQNIIFDDKTKEVKRCRRIFQMWQAMFLKKILITYRNKLIFLIQALLSVIFVIITICNVSGSSVQYTLVPLPIKLKSYPQAIIVLERAHMEDGSQDARIANEYESYARSLGSSYRFENTEGVPFQDYILTVAERELSKMNRIHLTGATINPNGYIAWFNNKPLHTAPLSLNLLHNAMARVLVGPDVEITVTNNPLPYSNDTLLYRLNKGTRLGTEIALNLTMCLCFVTAIFVIPVIRERETRAKLLQYINGMSTFIYWVTTFLWDMLTFVFIALLTLLTIACFQEKGFSTSEDLSRYLLILIVFAAAVLPCTYLLGFCFRDTANGFTRISIFNLFVGVGLFSVYIALNVEAFDLKYVADEVIWYFRVFPHFSLALGMHHLHVCYTVRNGCQLDHVKRMPESSRCRILPICCDLPNYFAWRQPGVLPEIIYMLIFSVIMILLLFAIDNGILAWLRMYIKNRFKPRQRGGADSGIDDDILAECQRIGLLTPAERVNFPLIVDRVSKKYGKHLAVNNVSFCVNAAECFGLLGINGAGKTSLFKMLTGDETITSGYAYVLGICINTNMRKIFTHLGYCPQFDGVLEELTGRETIRMHCLIRGIRKSSIRPITKRLAQAFGFVKHLDQCISHYSGGNKRKLCAALALIGNPAIMYLDEPTSGMDPVARRQVWNVVTRVRDMGKSIVLTTHSMEECEALCTRLAIMVRGELKCMGSQQYLKNRFSKGLILKLKVSKSVRIGIDMETQTESKPQLAKSSVVFEPETKPKTEQEQSTEPEPERSKDAETQTQQQSVTEVKSSKSLSQSQKSINQNNSRFAVDAESALIQKQEQELHTQHSPTHYVLKIKQFIKQKLPDAELKHEYQGLLTYYIPFDNIKWSQLFALIEKNRNTLNIEDYSISQTTLEEIFLEFADEPTVRFQETQKRKFPCLCC